MSDDGPKICVQLNGEKFSSPVAATSVSVNYHDNVLDVIPKGDIDYIFNGFKDIKSTSSINVVIGVMLELTTHHDLSFFVVGRQTRSSRYVFPRGDLLPSDSTLKDCAMRHAVEQLGHGFIESVTFSSFELVAVMDSPVSPQHHTITLMMHIKGSFVKSVSELMRAFTIDEKQYDTVHLMSMDSMRFNVARGCFAAGVQLFLKKKLDF